MNRRLSQMSRGLDKIQFFVRGGVIDHNGVIKDFGHKSAALSCTEPTKPRGAFTLVIKRTRIAQKDS